MFIRILILCLLFSSCSTMKKTMFTASLGGSVIGGTGGVVFSPNRESTQKNAFIFSLLGAGIGAMLGYMAYDKPDHQKMKPSMLLDQNPSEVEVPIFNSNSGLKDIKPKINLMANGKYKVPLKDLPNELKGKVKKQYVLEYVSEPQTIKVGSRTIQIDSFKAWEHVYEDE